MKICSYLIFQKKIMFQYSGFQQTAEKCAICGHLIMEMVSVKLFLELINLLK